MSAMACANCLQFVGDAEGLEREIAGLKILSSAFGSVRAETGLCRQRGFFCVADHHCPDWRAKPANEEAPGGADG